MSKLVESIRSANWARAIGEIGLIVVGVTLALAATSWYENQQSAQDERRILAEIDQALSIDLANLKGFARRHRSLYKRSEDIGGRIGVGSGLLD